MQRLALGEAAARQRPRAGARHLLVDAPVEHVIDGGGARRGERDAEIAPHAAPRSGGTPGLASSVPTIAVKVMSATTLGLVSSR